MKISELILKLQNIQNENEDIQVVVQYRDEGGIYDGYDEDIDPFYSQDEQIVIL